MKTNNWNICSFACKPFLNKAIAIEMANINFIKLGNGLERERNQRKKKSMNNLIVIRVLCQRSLSCNSQSLTIYTFRFITFAKTDCNFSSQLSIALFRRFRWDFEVQEPFARTYIYPSPIIMPNISRHNNRNEVEKKAVSARKIRKLIMKSIRIQRDVVMK